MSAQVQTTSPTNGVPTVEAPAWAPLASDEQKFGLSEMQLHLTHAGLQAIHARVSRIITDQTRQHYVMLNNGQTWMMEGEDARLGVGDLVTIKRASLGSFLMLTPSKRSYRVSRTQ
jgi:hypothetical protein